MDEGGGGGKTLIHKMWIICRFLLLNISLRSHVGWNVVPTGLWLHLTYSFQNCFCFQFGLSVDLAPSEIIRVPPYDEESEKLSDSCL